MQNPFDDLLPVHARLLARDFASPLYLICEQTLTRRMDELQRELNAMAPHAAVAYSYKTNPLHGLINLLHRRGAWAEVVSGHEYRLAESQGVAGEHIVFNGPAKRDDELTRAVAAGALINADNFDELQRLGAIGHGMSRAISVGIRLILEQSDTAWNRFGFDWFSGEAWRCIQWIQQQPGLQLSGVHCHLGTNIRDLTRFQRLGMNLAEVVARLRLELGVELKWIDMGGGLAGISPRWDEPRLEPHPPIPARDYLQSVLPPLVAVSPHSRIILEPGRTLVDACGGLLMSVMAGRGQATWVVDGGINVSPTVRTYRHPLRLAAGARADEPPVHTRLLGNSCMNHDCITDQAWLPPLNPDDLLLMHGLGAYNLSRTVPFIHLRPGCVLWRGPERAPEWLRIPECLEDTRMLERIPH